MYNTGQGSANSVFKQVVNYRNSYLGPLLLGGYAYHLPRNFSEYAYVPCTNFDLKTGALVDVWFDMMDNSIVNVYSARSINTGENNGMVRRSLIWDVARNPSAE